MAVVSSYTGRDNNFNLLRALAAFGVLYSHSYALTDGRGLTEPVRALLGVSVGGIAVDVFFVISGFLVTASLLSRQSAKDFIRGRFFRVFPALIVMVSFTVLVIGPWLTSLSVCEYFSDKEVFKYFYKNVTLIGGVTYKLPGVFEGNPYPLAVNGSLWTLPIELKMYGYLLGAWIVLGMLSARRARLFCGVVLFACLSGVAMQLFSLISDPAESQWLRLFAMFFSGAALQICKDRVPLDWRIFVILCMALLVSISSSLFFKCVFTLVLPYLVIYLVYVPSWGLRSYNKAGDYSYGLYLYAFPIQQVIAALLPGVGVFEMVVWAGLATLLCAVLSWRYVEGPALLLIRRQRQREAIRQGFVSESGVL